MKCLVNGKEGAENLPKVLVFQGSYYNERYQFLESAFREYDAIHNYENFIDFDYYFNIFQPDCVIMESAEYATNGSYFSYEGLEDKQLNPVLDIKAHKAELEKLAAYDPEIEKSGNLVKLTVKLPEQVSGGYLIIGRRQFDFSVSEDGTTVECTVDKRYFKQDRAKVFWVK